MTHRNGVVVARVLMFQVKVIKLQPNSRARHAHDAVAAVKKVGVWIGKVDTLDNSERCS